MFWMGDFFPLYIVEPSSKYGKLLFELSLDFLDMLSNVAELYID